MDKTSYNSGLSGGPPTNTDTTSRVGERLAVAHSQLQACLDACVDFERTAGSSPAFSGSELGAALDLLVKSLLRTHTFVEALESHLADGESRIVERNGDQLISLAWSDVYQIATDLSDLFHDLKTPLALLRIQQLRRPEKHEQEARLKQYCAQLQWCSSQLTEIVDSQNDVVVDLNDLLHGEAAGKGTTDWPITLVAALPPTRGRIRARFRFAVRRLLHSLSEPHGGVIAKHSRITITANIAEEGVALKERRLMLLVELPALRDSGALASAMEGRFGKDLGGPYFRLYVARRMLLECGADVVLNQSQAGLSIHVSIPFAEVD